MQFSLVAIALGHLVRTALTAAEPMPYGHGSLSIRGSPDLMKRGDGYQPSQTFCGPGSTCSESCGPNFVQCDSKGDNMHCYDPVQKETCCADGSGNSCQKDFFCTSDSSKETWCCPNGMDLKICAQNYGLNDILVSQVQTSTSSSSVTTESRSQVVSSMTFSSSDSTTTSSAVALPTSIYSVIGFNSSSLSQWSSISRLPSASSASTGSADASGSTAESPSMISTSLSSPTPSGSPNLIPQNQPKTSNTTTGPDAQFTGGATNSKTIALPALILAAVGAFYAS